MNTNLGSRIFSMVVTGALMGAAASPAMAGKKSSTGSGGTSSNASSSTTPNFAGMAGAKISVQKEGWYSVSRQNLINAGWDPGTSPTYLQLWCEGHQQAILVNTGSNKTFDATDTIEFYGTGLDNPFTSSRVYWLLQGSAPGLRIATASANKKTTAAPASFSFTSVEKDRSIYFINLTSNGDQDNWFGPVVSPISGPVSETIQVPHPASGTSSVTLEIALQGATWSTHDINVEVNGNPAGSIVFSGMIAQTTNLTVPQSWIVPGANSVVLAAAGGDADYSVIDTMSLTYPHLYTADQNSLKFTAAGNLSVPVSGFSSSAVRVFDITAPASVQLMPATVKATGGSYSVSVGTSSQVGSMTFLALSQDQVLAPASIVANVVSNLKATTNRADFIILSSSSFLGAVAPLQALRKSQGMTVSVVNLTDVYDEFSAGEKDPQAIKDFLLYTQSSWAKPAPRYVVLVGGASSDPRNYSGYGSNDFVPTKLIATGLLKTASDDWFVDFNNDGLPDMAIGRLPVRTVQEASAIIGKITSYGQASGSWKKNVLLVADQNDSSNDFESASASVQALVPATYSSQSVLAGQVGGAAANAAILQGISAGQLVVNYSGHGSEQAWGPPTTITGDDAANMSNASQLPFVVSMGCLTGMFQDPYQETLSETFLKNGNGGAVAFWGSSGMTGILGETAMNQRLFSYLFNGTHPTLGDAVAQAKSATTDPDVRRTWIFFGDPTMKLAQ
ncbi:MAG: C25 family cysteine peptidase [Thermoanaerobaculia bacterium]